MRPSNLATLAAVGLAVAAPLGVGAQQTTIGMGNKSCTLKPGADCSRVVHKWSAAFHGDAHGAKFTRADLRGADLRGADLRDANLKGARFGLVTRVGKRANQLCAACGDGQFVLGAGDLTGLNLAGANLAAAKFFYSKFTNVNL